MITPEKFLQIIQIIKDNKEKSSFKLGKIDPDYTGGDPRIVFDGESSASAKAYKTVSYAPVANDRVLLARVAGTYLVLGEIGGAVTATGVGIADADENFTSTHVEGALAELFAYVSNGKSLIAAAITDRGQQVSGSDTFEQLADAIRAI
jgi:hypothetical protein